ncbi:MAG: VRR-NUC domain-containing protein [Chloroflexi bacterium]|nr:VRR-NUC domain-containing protein [Chloroflexota bacterium]
MLLGALSEREFQAHVLAVAKRNGWHWFHDQATNAPRRCPGCGAVRRGPRNAAGLPDLLLVRGERLIWAELKAQDGTTTPEQREWIARLRAAGETVHVWRPADWPVIEKELARE